MASAILALDGCHVVEETAKLPARTMATVVPRTAPKGIQPAELQAQVLRYADDFFSRTSSGLEDYARRMGTAEARREAMDWKVGMDSSALGVATSPNPVANLVDFLALSSLTRVFLEARTEERPESKAALQSWLDHSRILETNAWKLAEGVLSPAQQAEFRETIQRWHAENLRLGAGFFRRPQELASGLRENQKQAQPGSVFGLIGLDPMAGLDPAVREVTRTRLFAERALFAMERMPFLLRWQTEMLTDDLLNREQITNALASADRLVRTLESASQTAAALPDRVTAERQAIVGALDAQEGKLKDLASGVKQTLEAGERMSVALNTTIATFNALMKRFGVGEPNARPPRTNAPPFNILDYARTAEQVAAMAREIDALIENAGGTLDAPALDKRVEALTALAAGAKRDVKSVLNHAFLLCAGLVLLIFASWLAVRRFSSQAALARKGGTEESESVEKTRQR